VRDSELRLHPGSDPLPRPGQLVDAAARASCLRRFAHHELMAVELFAWALLRWPDAPPGLRRGWLGALADEQRHCALYLQRLRAHGQGLGDGPLGDYFWRHVPALDAHPDGPLAFLCAMGLTLEQANLDFTLRFRDAFRDAGDLESAQVCQLVHDEERQHVHLALQWLRKLKDPQLDDVAAYDRSVPHPLSAARAKARGFHVQARRSAGLDEDFIEHVRRARSPQELAGNGR
jgi:uncharacterized ferritin-like protein (DUF455 family)